MTFLSGDKDDFWSLYECLKHRSGEFVPLFNLEKAFKNSFLSESFHCQGKQNNNNGVDTNFSLILHHFLDLKLLSTTFHEVCEVINVNNAGIKPSIASQQYNSSDNIDDFLDSLDSPNYPNACFNFDLRSSGQMYTRQVTVCHQLELLKLCGDVELNPGPISLQANVPTGSARQMTVTIATTAATATATTAATAATATTASTSATAPATDGNESAKTKAALQVMTLNVRGLNDSKKVRHLVNNCYKKCSLSSESIFMFQETYVSSLKLLDYIWRGEYHLTPGMGNSVGCITLLSSTLKIVHSVNIGDRGHILAVSRDNVTRVEFIIVNVYAPNGLDANKTEFMDEVVQRTGEIQTLYNCSVVILAGDLNIVFKNDEVKNRAFTTAESRTAAIIKQSLDTLDLADGWNFSEKKFTWTSCRNGKQAFSTLDRVLYSDGKLQLLTKTADWSLSLSDHAAVTALFDLPNPRNKSKSFIPRLDPNILQDPECAKIMDEIYNSMMSDSLPTWDPHMSLEYCKLCMRTAANAATGKMKASYRDEEKSLNQDINNVVNKLSSLKETEPDYLLYVNKLDDLRSLKRQLVDKIGTKLERRTASKWYNEGELSNKYFFNLLNRRSNDEISSLIINDQVCQDQSKINKTVQEFYKDLYEKLPNDLSVNDEFFRHIDAVDPEGAKALTREITLDELTETLKECADSAPGPDGIPYSFIKYHWSTFGPILLKAWQHSLKYEILPPSHKVSYLRLIPKAGKDTRLISNLRPITLSNTDHKLITKTYSKKLTALVADCIGQEQTAYIPGRLINDNIRAMLTTMDLANIDTDVDGSIISLDAKKAFDSVDHRYIVRCLNAFGLSGFVPIFRILYKELRSEIILNGNIVKGYHILKGVKQGDALSCILFIICMEPLIRNIKNNPRIESIASEKLRIEIPKVYGFADDINVIAKATDNGVQEIFSEYQLFTAQSGLHLNADKTEIVLFNGRREKEREFRINYGGSDYVINAKEKIKINGILFQQDPTRREADNVEKVIDAMTKHLRQWSRRHLTLFGKILILKTFAISQVIFTMQSLTLCDNSLKKINAVVYKYLWNKNFNASKAPDRIKRSIMVTPLSRGGFGMLDLKELNTSLDLRSYSRLIASEHPFFKQISSILQRKGFFNIDLSNFAVDRKLKLSIELINEQRKKVLRWPDELIDSDVNLREAIMNTELTQVLTNAGRNSLAAFRARRRVHKIKLSQLTIDEATDLSRHMNPPGLHRIVQRLTRNPVNNVSNIPPFNLYPIATGRVLKLTEVTSKTFRTGLIDFEDQVICLYKSGLTLQPGEVLSWATKIRKLTSTRHKNSVLRIAHGDVYTNDRLCRFGLIDNPKCIHCDHPIETLIHRLIECPNAARAWHLLSQKLSDLDLIPMGQPTLENILGVGEDLSKLTFALVSELALKLASGNGNATCPEAMVKSCLKVIAIGEKLPTALRKSMLT